MMGYTRPYKLKLKDILAYIIHESTVVCVMDGEGNTLSVYDGVNSISKALVNLLVYQIDYMEYHGSPALFIEVFDPEEE